jgi:hypothetical protein
MQLPRLLTRSLIRASFPRYTLAISIALGLSRPHTAAGGLRRVLLDRLGAAFFAISAVSACADAGPAIASTVASAASTADGVARDERGDMEISPRGAV